MTSIKMHLTGWFEWVQEKLRPYLEEQKIIKKHDSILEEKIVEAHREWIDAQQYFESVSEPELVDHAIYMIQAAKTKYMYLLNKAKKMS